MESAHGAPIDASGTREAAGSVIGVNPCGCDPVCHDGRSVSVQAWDGNSGNNGNNNGSRLIHGGARVAPLTQARAPRWISRDWNADGVHRMDLTRQ